MGCVLASHNVTQGVPDDQNPPLPWGPCLFLHFVSMCVWGWVWMSVFKSVWTCVCEYTCVLDEGGLRRVAVLATGLAQLCKLRQPKSGLQESLTLFWYLPVSNHLPPSLLFLPLPLPFPVSLCLCYSVPCLFLSFCLFLPFLSFFLCLCPLFTGVTHWDRNHTPHLILFFLLKIRPGPPNSKWEINGGEVKKFCPMTSCKVRPQREIRDQKWQEGLSVPGGLALAWSTMGSGAWLSWWPRTGLCHFKALECPLTCYITVQLLAGSEV